MSSDPEVYEVNHLKHLNDYQPNHYAASFYIGEGARELVYSARIGVDNYPIFLVGTSLKDLLIFFDAQNH